MGDGLRGVLLTRDNGNSVTTSIQDPLIRAYNFRTPKNSLGQHFLIDETHSLARALSPPLPN